MGVIATTSPAEQIICVMAPVRERVPLPSRGP